MWPIAPLRFSLAWVFKIVYELLEQLKTGALTLDFPTADLSFLYNFCRLVPWHIV